MFKDEDKNYVMDLELRTTLKSGLLYSMESNNKR